LNERIAMISDEVRNKIKKIKIQTTRIMQSNLSGDYLSAFKGTGLEFDQLREYQMGDDVRFIDWNSSAKMNKIMIKQFIEERDRTVILAIDLSASAEFSSQKELRKDIITQISGALALIADHSKDKIGALFFTDRVEKWIPPSRGSLHVGKILETIFSLQPIGKKTDLTTALRFLVSLKKRNAVVFMLSDWIDNQGSYEKLLKVASCEYDFVGIRLLDTCEKMFPDIGLLDIYDSETGTHVTIDSRKLAKSTLQPFLHARMIEQKRLFDTYKIDLLDLTIGQAWVNPLIHFFHLRTRRQI
jgi:uncharacterized protein (DUF58 family)